MADLAEIIRSHPLFSALSREEVAKVLGKLEEKFFSAGTTIFSQGDAGDAFYLIESGNVQVVLENPGAKPETIAVFGVQDWFGEMALFSGEPRSASILALKDTIVWRLSREDWCELIDKHPTWLLHFCANLSKRLSYLDRQYSQSREVFKSLAEEFYSSRPPEEQEFLRHISLLNSIDSASVDFLLDTAKAREFLLTLENSHLPFIQRLDHGKYELQHFFRDFLAEKLAAVEEPSVIHHLHTRLASRYAERESWEDAVYHFIEGNEWAEATRLLIDHKEEFLNRSATFIRHSLQKISPDYFYSDLRLVHLQVETLAHLGEFRAAVTTYKDILLQRAPAGGREFEVIGHYRRMAENLAQKQDYTQALNCLRNAMKLLEQENSSLAGDMAEPYRDKGSSVAGQLPAADSAQRWQTPARVWSLLSEVCRSASLGRWIGAVLGLSVWAYLWFLTPDIGLEPAATKQLGLLCLTFIFWVFWVLPDYGVALIFVLALIVTGLGSAEQVLSGFASTTWFMTLGVLGLGAAITSSGLFYRLSLQLVKFFPLTYYWQTVALGFMGVVITALIPQQTARTAISSQMLLNLSESLGYKTPSKASTGLFSATFLGLGQVGFLYLTGSTSNLLAWGLLPRDVRAEFTWGMWFLAALPPTLVVIVVVLVSTIFLYRPETQARISYEMVHNQLQVLGPLSRNEWVTLGTLIFMVGGWLSVSYHGIDSAWISLIGLCVLINTGVLGWGMMKKGIDWEMLIYLGATLSIPAILSKAKIDQWLLGFISPFILPLVDRPMLAFIVIALMIYVLKLVFTSGLAVITLSILLIPLSEDLGISPWIMVMIILISTEVWFFPFQVDWHTLAYSSTEGKGFTYRLLCRMNPIYALAYILALMAAIPYWRYLGLMN